MSIGSALLVVDDQEANRDLLTRRLRHSGYQVEAAADGMQALQEIAKQRFALVLLDLEMPGMSGLHVLRQIRARHTPSELPVIIVSAHQDGDSIISALQAGANDYVTKPIDFPVALARVDAQLMRREIDIARQRTDALTGLPTTPVLADRWELQGRVGAILCVNLDRFRTINVGLGWTHGDVIIRQAAARITAQTGTAVARGKADQFWILSEPEAALATAERVQLALREPYRIGDGDVYVTASVGFTVEPAPCSLEDALERADTALHRAKTLGGNRCEAFTPMIQSRALDRMRIETELVQALAAHRLELKYQPIVHLESGEIVGFEALVRSRNAHGAELMPADFIAVAEESGLIVPLGACVLREVCGQIRRWQDAGTIAPPFSVSVNISGRQLREPGFADLVERTLQSTGVDAALLKLEITETVLMENTDSIRQVLRRLLSLGVEIALDDFGTGYSSLSCLQHFSLQGLKIDRGFIHGVPESPARTEIVRAIVTLARSFGMTVVAEGIETPPQLAQLRALGCNLGQGYLFSQPVAADQAAALLSAQVT